MKKNLEGYWSWEMVEQCLVETMRLWRRSPGDGRWPFASDGPWHLVKRELYGPDVDKDEPVRPLPLSRADVRRRDQASGWLLEVPERDRRLVCLALLHRARGAKQVPWGKLKRAMGIELGSDGLRRRCERGITDICKALNARKIEGRAWQGVEFDDGEISGVHIEAEKDYPDGTIGAGD